MKKIKALLLDLIERYKWAITPHPQTYQRALRVHIDERRAQNRQHIYYSSLRPFYERIQPNLFSDF